jgi:hypothetical protein
MFQLKCHLSLDCMAAAKRPSDIFLFLRDFVDECSALQENGVSLSNVVYNFKIQSIL